MDVLKVPDSEATRDSFSLKIDEFGIEAQNQAEIFAEGQKECLNLEKELKKGTLLIMGGAVTMPDSSEDHKCSGFDIAMVESQIEELNRPLTKSDAGDNSSRPGQESQKRRRTKDFSWL
jgi:hypothetical protein